MHLTRLSLTNFRNFARLDIDLSQGALVLVGNNAQGKTSLLEAIYYVSTMVSFHAESDRQMINFLASREPLAVARIVADFCRGGNGHRLEVRIIQEPNGTNGNFRVRKEILLDGVKHKIQQVIGHFNAVLFIPQMLQIAEGAPEERRRYLNLALSQIEPEYAKLLGDYQRVLTRRNALLKQLFERGGDEKQLEYWDEKLTRFGARIIRARISAIRELEKLAASIHLSLTRNGEVLRMVYQPSYDPIPKPNQQYTLPLDVNADYCNITLETIETGFRDTLVKLHRDEIMRGVTTIGPHRDEVRFLGNGIDLGSFGSRGQVRTLILALKLAEVAWMQEKTGHWPVFLLDEVLAELDIQRRKDLLSRLVNCEQAILTTTDLDLFASELIDTAHICRIQDGRIQSGKE
ncbi:MAG: DNA replication/repair protein RecF [Anaerolineales bacterium]|nr:DNA replication/repair protein RecF [Anaerolineales bacterium]